MVAVVVVCLSYLIRYESSRDQSTRWVEPHQEKLNERTLATKGKQEAPKAQIKEEQSAPTQNGKARQITLIRPTAKQNTHKKQ